MIENEIKKDTAILVGVNLDHDPGFDRSMKELAELTKACDMEVVCIHTQNLSAPNTALYVGKGKVEEIKESLIFYEANTVIFDNALSPIQVRNLTQELDAVVLDRTALILQIFDCRAKTAEAKMQVELAKLQYMLPRLVGLHNNLSRQGGGSGSLSNKGAGEKKLELDRRKIEKQISFLKRELADMEQNKEVMRKKRNQSALPKVALVGYTNAGKSTILNQFVSRYSKEEGKQVLEKDMLFATLDTTIRKINPGNGNPAFLLSDTVGFINKLPHSLVKAFHSTLEEVTFADVVLQVVDASDAHHTDHIRVTQETLKELGAETIPCIYVYNKAERIHPREKLPFIVGDKIYLSAKEQLGMDALLNMLYETIFGSRKKCNFLLPLSRGDILNTLFQTAVVSSYEYREDGIFCSCLCSDKELKHFAQYSVNKG